MNAILKTELFKQAEDIAKKATADDDINFETMRGQGSLRVRIWTSERNSHDKGYELKSSGYVHEEALRDAAFEFLSLQGLKYKGHITQITRQAFFADLY